MLAKVQKHITPGVAIVVVALAALSAVGVFFYTAKAPNLSSVRVTRGAIISRLSATGQVVAAETVDLGFQRGGTIRTVNVAVGDRVSAGQVLATLSSADVSAQRAQAQAAVAAQQAQLASLKTGTRSEELDAARKALAAALTSGYSTADDAIHNRVDQFVVNPRSDARGLLFLSSNSTMQQNVLNDRGTMDSLLAAWNAQSTSDETLSTNAQAAERTLSRIASFLGETSNLLTTAIPNGTTQSVTIAGYQSSISTARSAVAQSLASLNAADSRLSLDNAGATSQSIDAQQASVQAAQAAVDLVDAQLSQTVIRAPIAGVITRQDGNVGESVAPNQTFLTLMSASRFQIDAYVSEADMAHIKAGDKVSVRLDAYPDDSFDATIISIDPAATTYNGALAYKVVAQFAGNDSRIKAGLTANVSVVTGNANDALLIPASAVITTGTQQSVVRVEADGSHTLVPVTLGLQSADGTVQVLSGLKEGDSIAAFGSSAIMVK